ncbi:hypothetical protein G1K73_13095 [Tenacibaculum finnmarkense]|uniref:hypothetical protein n=1 Tax=Tenacibaculum finnmarkense TaxID=2781243 RepID=UPI001EFB7249|nr:hypothetical protein [Tenacibaculum finnmarkense]MCG8894678.1 hypothetical protein [Tenacibaculum finnmarkense]
MFLKNLFKKPQIILTGEIYLSNNHSSFDILTKNKPIEDEELILLCLLVYSRILKVLSSRKEKDNLLEVYGEFYQSFKNSSNQLETINRMLTFLNIISKPSRLKSKKSIKLKKFGKENVYLDMGTIMVDPLSSTVHTVFIYVFNNISNKKNKIYLLEAMTEISSLYKKEKFTTLTQTEWPNIITKKIINYKENLDYEISF